MTVFAGLIKGMVVAFGVGLGVGVLFSVVVRLIRSMLNVTD